MKTVWASFAVAIILVLLTQGTILVASHRPLTADAADLTEDSVDTRPVYTPDYARIMFVEKTSRIATDGANSIYALGKDNRLILSATVGILDNGRSDSDDILVAEPYSVLGVAPVVEEITGPVNGVVQAPYTFTVTVGPINVEFPITYIWEASGQSDVITHTSNDSKNDTVTFTWDTPGVQMKCQSQER